MLAKILGFFLICSLVSNSIQLVSYMNLNDEYNTMKLKLEESNTKLLKSTIKATEVSVESLLSDMEKIDISKLELSNDIKEKRKVAPKPNNSKECTKTYDDYASQVLIDTLEKIK